MGKGSNMYWCIECMSVLWLSGLHVCMVGAIVCYSYVHVPALLTLLIPHINIHSHHRAIDKILSLGVLIYSEMLSEAILTIRRSSLDKKKSYKNVPSEGADKIWGCFSIPKHLLVYGLASGLPTTNLFFFCFVTEIDWGMGIPYSRKYWRELNLAVGP